MIRQGVILASGLGSRLAENGHEEPKPLMPVGGVPLLERNIKLMKAAGIDKVIVVVGFKHEMIEDYIKKKDINAVTVYNPDFMKKNGISLIAAAAELDMNEPFILSMSDHLFSDDYMGCFIDKAFFRIETFKTVLAVDRDIDGIFDLDDATKVFTEDDRIVEIGKEIAEYNAVDTGLFLCRPVIIDVLREINDKNGDASLSDGMKALADKKLFSYADMTGFLWQDVDTPDMMAEAEKRLVSYNKPKASNKTTEPKYVVQSKVTEILDEITDRISGWCTELPFRSSILILAFSAVSVIMLILGLKFDIRFFSLLIIPIMLISGRTALLSGGEDIVSTLFSSTKAINLFITVSMLPVFFDMHVAFALFFTAISIFPFFKKEIGIDFNISSYIPLNVRPFMRFEIFMLILLVSLVFIIPSFFSALLYIPFIWFNCEKADK